MKEQKCRSLAFVNVVNRIAIDFYRPARKGEEIAVKPTGVEVFRVHLALLIGSNVDLNSARLSPR